MFDVSAHAVRVGNTIEVTVFGLLPDSCHQAAITDKYPGGKIVYIKDPGFAQVFITETAQPNAQFCTMRLVPFMQRRTSILPTTRCRYLSTIQRCCMSRS